MPEPRILFFAAASCPYCDRARLVLEQCGEAFVERRVNVDRQAMADLLGTTGEATVPTLVIGDRILIGFDQECLEAMLHEPDEEEEAVGPAPASAPPRVDEPADGQAELSDQATLAYGAPYTSPSD